MDENIRNNIFYRPQPSIEKNYYSEGRFEKVNPATEQEEIEYLTDIEEIAKRNQQSTEMLLALHDMVPLLPEQLKKPVDSMVTELVFVINDPKFNEDTYIETEPPTDREEKVIVPQPEIKEEKDVSAPEIDTSANDVFTPKEDYVVDEDGYIWGEADGSGVTVELIEVKSNAELAREQYMNDISLIVEDYAKNLTHVLQKYVCNLYVAMNETGLDKVEYLNYDYEGESVKGIPDDLQHLSDTISRNQLIMEETSRLYRKTHSDKASENIIAALDIIAQERIRYYREKYDLEIKNAVDITNRELLRKCRAEYDNRYFQAKLDLFKFLGSSVAIIEDILNMAKDLQQAKAKLLLEGINVFAHKKYDNTEVANSVSQNNGSSAASEKEVAKAASTSSPANTSSSKYMTTDEVVNDIADKSLKKATDAVDGIISKILK